MAIFQAITLTWKGTDFEVPADRVMRLIAVVEQHVRINDLISEQGPPLSKLATAYAAALRFAGARVGDDEVYADFFTTGPEVAAQLANGLLSMMIPPDSLKRGDDGKKDAPPAK